MGTNELRGRDVWQDFSGENAAVAEQSFFAVFEKEFRGTEYKVRAKPREFKNIYYPEKTPGSAGETVAV